MEALIASLKEHLAALEQAAERGVQVAEADAEKAKNVVEAELKALLQQIENA